MDFLIIAGLCEMLGVTFMNWALQRHIWPLWLGMVIGYGLSFGFDLALQTLPMGTAYAIWTGIGAAGGVLTGMLFFGESELAQAILGRRHPDRRDGPQTNRLMVEPDCTRSPQHGWKWKRPR